MSIGDSQRPPPPGDGRETEHIDDGFLDELIDELICETEHQIGALASHTSRGSAGREKDRGQGKQEANPKSEVHHGGVQHHANGRVASSSPRIAKRVPAAERPSRLASHAVPSAGAAGANKARNEASHPVANESAPEQARDVQPLVQPLAQPTIPRPRQNTAQGTPVRAGASFKPADPRRQHQGGQHQGGQAGTPQRPKTPSLQPGALTRPSLRSSSSSDSVTVSAQAIRSAEAMERHGRALRGKESVRPGAPISASSAIRAHRRSLAPQKRSSTPPPLRPHRQTLDAGVASQDGLVFQNGLVSQAEHPSPRVSSTPVLNAAAVKSHSAPPPPPPARASSRPAKASSLPPPLRGRSGAPPAVSKATHGEQPSGSAPTLGPPRVEPGPIKIDLQAGPSPTHAQADQDARSRGTIAYTERHDGLTVQTGNAQPVTSETPKTLAGHPLVKDALALIDVCKASLRNSPGSPSKSASLHYEIARLYENPVRDLPRAHRHYQQALQLTPESLPILRGARRTAIARGKFANAAELLDAEARITSDPHQKSYLLLAKGRMLEDELHRPDQAAETYEIALELDKGDASLLKAVEQGRRKHGLWDALDLTYERLSNLFSGDPNHRSALMTRRAQLTELQKHNQESATELYEVALELEGRSPVAIDALKRLLHNRRRWRDLIRVLEIEAEHATHAEVRVLALLRIARLYQDFIGVRNEAIQALERAHAQLPEHVSVLQELARLYEAADRYDSLVLTLKKLSEQLQQPTTKIHTLHRIGVLLCDKLERPEEAITWLEAARQIQPDHLPVTQLLTQLYLTLDRPDALIALHEGEAGTAKDPQKRAASYASIAQIHELKREDVPAAIASHKRALTASPGYSPSVKALSRLYASTQAWRDLVDLYERQADFSTHQTSMPDRAIAFLFKVGDICEEHLGDFVQAAHAYKRILGISPQHIGGLHALQRANERAGRYKELVEALELEAEITVEPLEVATLLHRAGEILDEQLGDRDGALARFRRILSIDSKYRPAIRSLGQLYHRMGRWENLLDMYRRELELTPTGHAAVMLLQKMAELCEDRIGREDEAVTHYKRAVQIDPTYMPAVQALISRMQRRAQWDELLRVYALYLDHAQTKEEKLHTSYEMGVVYEQHLRNAERAVEMYRAALDIAPTFRPAVDGLTRIYMEQQAWKPLVQLLRNQSERADDPSLMHAACVQEAEIWSEKLGDIEQAIACYSTVLERNPTDLGAMLALEGLFLGSARWSQLADIYGRQAATLQDSGARVAALRELARLQASERVGSVQDAIETYESILRIVPNDLHALESLEHIAYALKDDALLLRVCTRLSEVSDEPGEYLLRVAECLEVQGSKDALQAYRKALECLPTSLAATRGFSRVAESTDDPEPLSEAARREAEVARDGQLAARLLVRSSSLRLERLGDREGALDDLQRALELWPDHRVAADRLITLLRVHGQEARLVALLAKAGDSAKEPERMAALWMEVASLQAEKLNNPPAAVAALSRVLRRLPNHLPTLQRLGELYERDGQWLEAIQVFRQIVQLSTNRESLCQTHLRLASLYHLHVGDIEQAKHSLQAILGMHTEHISALAMLATIEVQEGRILDARRTATQLVRAAVEPEAKASALVQLSDIEARDGQREAAIRYLLDAVAMQGSGKRASEAAAQLLHAPAEWSGYIDALHRFCDQPHRDPGLLVDITLEIARIQAERVGAPQAAVSTLEKGLEQLGSERIRRALALQQRAMGDHGRAIWNLQYLLAVDPKQAEDWRHLVDTFSQLEWKPEAALCLQSMSLLGAATEDEVAQGLGAQDAARNVRPGSFHSGIVMQIASFTPSQRMAADLVRVLEPALIKLHPPDLGSYDLHPRDGMKLQDEHHACRAAAQVAEIFDVHDLEVYVHRVRHRGVSVELGSPTALLLPAWLLERSMPEIRFRIGMQIANVAVRLHVFDKLMPRELEVFLAAASRRIEPSFGKGLTSEEYLNDLHKKIHKQIPRRLRRELDEAIGNYIAAPKLNFSRWAYSVSRNAVRCSASVVGDLSVAVQALQQDDRELGTLSGEALLAASPLILDLLRFWGSDKAMKLRWHIGALPSRQNVDPAEGQ